MSDVLGRIYKNIRIVPSGCWIWMGAPTATGYGRININRKAILVHRASYEAHNRAIPDGLCVCHHCDNRLCVNPKHLFVATQYENMQDMKKKGRASDTKGEKCGKAKLTERQVLEIYNSHLPGTALAKTYGVSNTAIYSIKKGKRWSHITNKI